MNILVMIIFYSNSSFGSSDNTPMNVLSSRYEMDPDIEMSQVV